ncbi:MAG: peptidase M48 [Bacteroidetes bacterium GWF2_38_335]|nr:MAG: peptidase M48 [Bacteroidetes bacterium GWF2_38_335]OFY78057.1 MAG: peptidase M48 [Bacteroidetes bacterium RIFOXYA12_FULL_38_20]HBS88329.1 peptidase M48 [Bacteroidales bacterium]
MVLSEGLLFIVFISIIIISFISDQVLEYLNIKNSSEKLPAELEDVYDAEKYARQNRYEKENYRFDIITSSFSLITVLLMFFLGGFRFADNLASDIISHPVLTSLIFFGIIMLASDIIDTPFSIYNIFVIEEKYGFNKTTRKTFILDKIKGWLLMAILGGGIFALIIWLFQNTGEYFWLLAWAAVSGFMIFMTMFYSSLIVPLFNKQTPLEEGELRSAIQEFSIKAGFKLDNIYVIDGSKRSTKANAYFSGLGTKKRIVLYDTLIKDLTVPQIVAVLAHEIGHYKLRHTLSSVITGIVQTGALLYLLSLFLTEHVFSYAMGADQPSFHMGMIAFGILFSPISTIIGLFMNTLSRKNEYAADKYAKDHYNGEELIGALKKLSEKNLSKLTPHPLYVFFNYLHPTLLQRIRAIRN